MLQSSKKSVFWIVLDSGAVSLSQLRFLHADRCGLGLVACKNLSWDKDFKVVSFLVPFLPRRRVSPTGLRALM